MGTLKMRAFGNTMMMDTATGHIHIAEGYIDQPGHPLHDKKLHRSHSFPNARGKKKGEPSSTTLTVEDGTETPPQFGTLDALMKHYDLKPMQEEPAPAPQNEPMDIKPMTPEEKRQAMIAWAKGQLGKHKKSLKPNAWSTITNVDKFLEASIDRIETTNIKGDVFRAAYMNLYDFKKFIELGTGAVQ